MSTNVRTSFAKFFVDGRCGKRLKFTRTCGISTTKRTDPINHGVRTGPKVSTVLRKVTTGKSRQGKYQNRMCACGDIYCNYISRFLGTQITEKCSYPHPDNGNTDVNKQLRSEKIYRQLTKFRKLRNDLFTIQVPPDPPKNTRFNEIHYSMLFLRSIKGSIQKIPHSIDVELAKQTNMFKEDLVGYYSHQRKTRVVVVPTLSAHQAIQVYTMF